MPRVLKSADFTLDANNRVKIDVADTPADEYAREIGEQQGNQSDAGVKKRAGATVEKIIDQATKGAEMIVNNAKHKAEILMHDAKVLSESLAAQQEEESRQQGYDIGYNEGAVAAQILQEEAAQTLADAHAHKEAMLAGVEGDVVDVIAHVMKKLLHDVADLNPEVILALVRAGLATTSLSGEITIRVSAEDYDTVLVHRDDILREIESSTNLDILKDLSLSPSDCIIETPFGNIDCGLSRQYQTLIENLYYIYHGSNQGSREGE